MKNMTMKIINNKIVKKKKKKKKKLWQDIQIQNR